jgi:hypothetical protein
LSFAESIYGIAECYDLSVVVAARTAFDEYPFSRAEDSFRQRSACKKNSMARIVERKKRGRDISDVFIHAYRTVNGEGYFDRLVYINRLG